MFANVLAEIIGERFVVNDPLAYIAKEEGRVTGWCEESHARKRCAAKPTATLAHS